MSAIGIAIQYTTANKFKLALTSYAEGIDSVVLNFSNIGTSAQNFMDYFNLGIGGGAFEITELGNYLIEIKKASPIAFTPPGGTFNFYGIFDITSASSSFFGLDFTTMNGLLDQTGIAGAYESGGSLIEGTINFSYKGLANNAVPLSDSQVYMLTGLGILAAIGVGSKAKKTYNRFRQQGMDAKQAALATAYTALALPYAIARETIETLKMSCKMTFANIKGLFRKADRAAARYAPAIN